VLGRIVNTQAVASATHNGAASGNLTVHPPLSLTLLDAIEIAGAAN
jgi:hypothetical protein